MKLLSTRTALLATAMFLVTSSAYALPQRLPAPRPCPITGCPITMHAPTTDRWNIVSAPGSEWVYYDEPISGGTAPMATELENNQTVFPYHLVRDAVDSGPVILASPPVSDCCIWTNYRRTKIHLADSQGNILNTQPAFQVVECQDAGILCSPQHDWLRITGSTQPEQLLRTQGTPFP